MSGRANRKEGREEADARGSSGFRHHYVAGGRRRRGPGRIPGTHRGFSDPLPRFQMLVNLPGSIFTRPLPPASGPLRLHSLCPSAEGARASPVQAAPIRGALCWGSGSLSACSPSGDLHQTPSTVYLFPGRLPRFSPPSPVCRRLPPASPGGVFLRRERC